MVVVVLMAVGSAARAEPVDEPPVEPCPPVTLDVLYPEGIHGPRAELPQDCEPFIYEMGFPLLRNVKIRDTFGDEREGGKRRHKGTDIFAPKLTPVVAVKDGIVRAVRPDSVLIIIRHDDGWESWYLHLNNDRYGTDDGQGAGIAPGVVPGARVAAGQVIGWVGDSGNAEPSSPHLHFELHDPDGVAVDAAPSLAAALEDADLPGFEGAFVDDEGLLQEHLDDLLVSLGLLAGRGAGDLAALDEVLTGTALARDLTVAFDRPVEPGRYLTYLWNLGDAGFLIDPRSGGVAALCGVYVYCTDQVITLEDLRQVMDGLAAEAFATAPVPNLGGCGLEPAATAGDRPATRADLVEMVARMVGLVADVPCDLIR